VVNLALRHKVTPLLYRNLRKVEPGAVPNEVMGQLQDLYQANAARNLLLVGQLLQALQRLEEDGIAAVSYRGPVLAKRAYGELALRQFNDLDILVHPADLERVRASLRSLDYVEETPYGVDVETYAQAMHHYAFQHSGGRVLLEVHWDITPKFFGSFLDPGLWQRTEWIYLAETRVRTLSAEDLMLILCVHSAVHGWQRLGWTCDVAELIRSRPGLGWAQLLLQARRLGAERMLLLGAYLAHNLLDVEVPLELRERFQGDRTLARLSEETLHRLFDRGPVVPGPAARFPLLGLHVALRATAWQKLQHCARVAFVPSDEDWEVVALSPSWSFLYYILRPLRLIRKHSARLLRRRLRAPL
jgi:hypothetical protein